MLDGWVISLGGKAGGKKLTTWSIDSPILVRAMVKAGNEILIAGPQRLYNEAEAIQTIEAPDMQENIRAQARAWHGDAQLHGIAASDGKHVRELALKSMPVWDGVVVATGALYISCEDGNLRCLK